MSKELIVSKGTELTAADITELGFGEVQPLDVGKIIVPKILAQQGMSKWVTSKEAELGDFVDSMTSEVLGNCIDTKRAAKRIDFIPFACEDQWIKEIGVPAKNGLKWVFKGTEPCTPKNEKREWNEMIDGQPWKFTRCLNFFVIRPDAPEIPMIIPFKSTSFKAGRLLYTQMMVKNVAVIGPRRVVIPCLNVMSLCGTLETNDDGTYVVINTKLERRSTLEEIRLCKNWMDSLNAGLLEEDASERAPVEAGPLNVAGVEDLTDCEF